MSTGYYCYVSSQTDTSEAKGIAIFDVEPDEGRLILRKEVELDNPIHMATSHDGRFLYAITDKGVASFEILPGGDLKRLNIGSIRGLRGCNISISPDDRWLFVSGHYDAKITVLEVNTDGSVGRIACGIFHKGLGVTERDFIPHVRCARLTPDGKYLCVSDDGLDHVVIYSFDSQTGSLKHLDIWDIECVGNAAGKVLTLVVAALGELAAVQGHGSYHIDAVKETAGRHVGHRACREPPPHSGDSTVFDVMQYRCIGGTFLIEEIGRSTLNGHLAGKELLHGIEWGVLIACAWQPRQTLAAQPLLVGIKRFATDGANAWQRHIGRRFQPLTNLLEHRFV